MNLILSTGWGSLIRNFLQNNNNRLFFAEKTSSQTSFRIKSKICLTQGNVILFINKVQDRILQHDTNIQYTSMNKIRNFTIILYGYCTQR